MSKLMGSRILPALALLAPLALGGCIDSGLEEEAEISAFSLSAVVEGKGYVEVAQIIADYARTVDERVDGARDDWKLTPQKQMDKEMPSLRAAIELPDERGYVVELCNQLYAGQSMELGKKFSVGLPCEVVIYPDRSDRNKTKVVIINPEAIYAVLFGGAAAEMGEARRIFSRTIHREFEVVVTRALKKLDVTYPRTPIGPSWTEQELEKYASIPSSLGRSVAIPKNYLTDGDSRKAYQDKVAKALLSVLTHAGMPAPGSQVPGLSVDDWQSPRPEEKLGVINFPLKVSVVELVSPTYLRQLLATGTYHAPALPFQFSFFVEGDNLQIHWLDPAAVFGAFFSDVDTSFDELTETIRADLVLLLDAALERVEVVG